MLNLRASSSNFTLLLILVITLTHFQCVYSKTNAESAKCYDNVAKRCVNSCYAHLPQDKASTYTQCISNKQSAVAMLKRCGNGAATKTCSYSKVNIEKSPEDYGKPGEAFGDCMIACLAGTQQCFNGCPTFFSSPRNTPATLNADKCLTNVFLERIGATFLCVAEAFNVNAERNYFSSE